MRKESFICSDTTMDSLTMKFEDFDFPKSRRTTTKQHTEYYLKTGHKWFANGKTQIYIILKVGISQIKPDLVLSWGTIVNRPDKVEIATAGLPSQIIMGDIYCTSDIHGVLKKKKRYLKSKETRKLKNRKRPCLEKESFQMVNTKGQVIL